MSRLGRSAQLGGSSYWLQAKERREHFLPRGHSRSSSDIPSSYCQSFLSSEQLPTIQASSPNAEIPIGAGKGKEVQPQTKAKHSKDDLTIKDVVSKAKDAESESKVANPKEDPHQAKA